MNKVLSYIVSGINHTVRNKELLLYLKYILYKALYGFIMVSLNFLSFFRYLNQLYSGLYGDLLCKDRLFEYTYMYKAFFIVYAKMLKQ